MIFTNTHTHRKRVIVITKMNPLFFELKKKILFSVFFTKNHSIRFDSTVDSNQRQLPARQYLFGAQVVFSIAGSI